MNSKHLLYFAIRYIISKTKPIKDKHPKTFTEQDVEPGTIKIALDYKQNSSLKLNSLLLLYCKGYCSNASH